MYVGDTTKEEYEEYVTDCSYYGFDIDYDKGENYYRAYNEDGYYLSLSYEGNNIMMVRIDETPKRRRSGSRNRKCDRKRLRSRKWKKL